MQGMLQQGNEVSESEGVSLSSIVLQGIQYLATVTEKGGKVYAFFVKSPTKVSPECGSCVIWEACMR